MKKKLISIRTLACVCVVMFAVQAGKAQTSVYGNELNFQNITVVDYGTTLPTPGSSDQSQLSLPTGSANPGTLNYYWTEPWLNNTYAPQAPGQTFTTGSAANGYVLNSLLINASPYNHAGGSYTYPLILNIYALSSPDSSQTGSPYTNATLIQGFENTIVTTITYGDWVEFTNLSIALAPNTQYAYTVSCPQAGSGDYANVSFVNGNPYSGGQVEAISLRGNNPVVNYGGVSTYDASFDIGLTPATTLTVNPPTTLVGNPVSQSTPVTLTAGNAVGGTGTLSFQWKTDGGTGGALTNISGATSSSLSVSSAALGNFSYAVTVTDSASHTVTSQPYIVNVITNLTGTIADLGPATPSLGNYDVYQLVGGYVPSGTGSDNLNYYLNTGSSSQTPAISGSMNFIGQIFTTGTNKQGYQMTSVAVDCANGTSSATTTSKAYDLLVYSILNGTNAALIGHVTSPNFHFSYGDWIRWTFPAINLNPNSVYAYTVAQTLTGGYAGLATSPQGTQPYAGGQIISIPNPGGSVTSNINDIVDAVFDVGLFPVGVPIVLSSPTASPNPVYALSPVTINSVVATTGTYTYQWLTDDGTGANPPNYITLTGQTGTNLIVTPKNIGNGNNYTTNYYVRVSDGVPADTATSLAVTLTVLPAVAPQLATAPNPAYLTTFAGSSVSYSVGSETGTLPITNQWQFNGGTGFTNISLQTNTTLTLTNLVVSQTGVYQMTASNVYGNTPSAQVNLTVLPDPASPATSLKYANSIFTNNPYAYWRLNESNATPGSAGLNPVYTAYDYSSNNFDATYLSDVTFANPGPSTLLTPSFPGFSSNELAAGTIAGDANGILTVPNLGLNAVTNMTFIAWINPQGSVPTFTGLFFTRGANANGFGFGGTANNLGYTWNNNSSTYNFNSGLTVQQYQWNYVAYIVTPTNTTIALAYLTGNGNPQFSFAVNNVANAAAGFNVSPTWIGGDPNSTARIFNGFISEAAVFTNALSLGQVEQFFLTAVGSTANVSAPTVFTPTVYPQTSLNTSELPAGQNVLLTGSFISPQNPTGSQWQASPDGFSWTNNPNATNSTLLINSTNVGVLYYQLVVTNPAGTNVSTPAVAVVYDPLPTSPPGAWTVNYELTNNLFNNGYYAYAIGKGIGHYVGRGILGNGSSWNYVPYVTTTVGQSKNLTNATDFQDNGTTHSGISCLVNAAYGGSSQTAPLPNPSDIANLLDQWVTLTVPTSAIQFSNVPSGNYNLALYSEFGASTNLGTIFVVHDSLNGNQTNSTLNNTAPVVPLALGANYVLFTNVHVSGGLLNIDAYPNPAASGVNINVEADFNGAQLQLVSYDPPTASFTGAPTSVQVGQPVVFTNTTSGFITNAIWSFGDSSTSTNSTTTNQPHAYSATGIYGVGLSVKGPGGVSSATNSAYITVTPFQPLSFGVVKLQTNQILMTGSGGAPGAQYRVLTSTNITTPLSSWKVVYTNTVAGNGTYGFTNAPLTNGASYFKLVAP